MSNPFKRTHHRGTEDTDKRGFREKMRREIRNHHREEDFTAKKRRTRRRIFEGRKMRRGVHHRDTRFGSAPEGVED
jgi:hypothetical protein